MKIGSNIDNFIGDQLKNVIYHIKIAVNKVDNLQVNL